MARVQGPPLYRPFKPGETRPNLDGTYSTELSVTMQLPNGDWVNVPSLWMGPNGPTEFDPADEDGIFRAASDYEGLLGETFPRFSSLANAERAAVERSQAGGVNSESKSMSPIIPSKFGSLGGLGGSDNFGNVMQALGMSLMGSPRNAPLTNFGPMLQGLQQTSMERRASEEQRAAWEQALIGAGIDPAMARTYAANPQAAKFQLDTMQQQQERARQQQQMNATREFLAQNDPELAAMVDAGMPVNEAFGEYVKRRNGGASQDEYAKRAEAARSLGLDPEDPRYQPFVLTGKMPREDAQELTATDKKAILEADEMVAANQNAVDMLSSVLTPDAEGRSLNDKAGYGVGADTQAWLARNDPTGFLDDEKGQATTELSNIVLNQALSTLKATFGAAPTEGERKILVDLQASVDKSPSERKAILNRAIEMANRRLAFNRQRAAELRGGTFYREGGGNPSATPPPPGARRTSTGVDWSM